MFGRLTALALALVALLPAASAVAQVEVTFAEEKVRKIIPETDRIDTRSIPGKYRGIRVYALEGTSVDISSIDIIYSDGSKFVEDRGRLIRLNPTDVRTRIIGPENGDGPEKFIDQIVMHYKTPLSSPIQARVKIAGITSQSGSRATRPATGGIATPAPTPSPSVTPAVIPSSPTPPVPAQVAPGTTTAGGDVLFGVQYVGFGIDRDVIKIGSEFGKFDKIRLRVLDNDIFINEMRVVYSNGDPDVLAFAANVPANSRTKWFALKGDRFIKEIQLIYKSRPSFKGQARVEVFGEFAEGWYGKPGEAGTGGEIVNSGEAFKHGSNRGWLYLGGQQPKFFSVSLKKGIGYETDTISVARNWGFNRMRLDVKDRAIQLNKLTINYGDGTQDTIPVGAKVDGGSSFGPVQLKRKPVKDIQVSYRSRVFDKNATTKAQAFVEFWAQ